MWHVIGLYRRLIWFQIRSQLAYRTSFLLDLFATLLGTGGSLGTLTLIFQRFDHIAGWTMGEVVFLYGLVEAAFGAMDLLFGGFDPGNFGQQVRRGSLDLLLLRPTSVTLQVLGSKFILRRLGRIAQGVVALGIALAMTDIRWTVLKAAYLPVVFASIVAFFGGLFIVGATITFWTVESIEAINILTYGGAEMMSYPMHIYGKGIRRFFTYVVPAILLTYYPALYILDKPDPLGFPSFAPFLAPAAGLGTLAVALVFWRFGLRHYESTGT